MRTLEIVNLVIMKETEASLAFIDPLDTWLYSFVC